MPLAQLEHCQTGWLSLCTHSGGCVSLCMVFIFQTLVATRSNRAAEGNASIGGELTLLVALPVALIPRCESTTFDDSERAPCEQAGSVWLTRRRREPRSHCPIWLGPPQAACRAGCPRCGTGWRVWGGGSSGWPWPRPACPARPCLASRLQEVPGEVGLGMQWMATALATTTSSAASPILSALGGGGRRAVHLLGGHSPGQHGQLSHVTHPACLGVPGRWDVGSSWMASALASTTSSADIGLGAAVR